MNAKISLFIICVEAIIYLLLYNLHECAFKYDKKYFSEGWGYKKISIEGGGGLLIGWGEFWQKNLRGGGLLVQKGWMFLQGDVKPTFEPHQYYCGNLPWEPVDECVGVAWISFFLVLNTCQMAKACFVFAILIRNFAIQWSPIFSTKNRAPLQMFSCKLYERYQNSCLISHLGRLLLAYETWTHNI